MKVIPTPTPYNLKGIHFVPCLESSELLYEAFHVQERYQQIVTKFTNAVRQNLNHGEENSLAQT